MLIENSGENCQLHREHGLSIYIETKGHKILFDAGQTDAFAENAKKMQLPLEEVDLAILSHGHYDHSGGYTRFLAQNQKAKLFINEHAFGTFYNGREKEIGIDPKLRQNKQVFLTSDYMEIGEGIELITCNGYERKFSSNSLDLYREAEAGKEVDPFLHEQYLRITEDGKQVVISGCSHKGIQNIVAWFQPDVLIGGFHFKGIEVNEEGKAILKDHAHQLMKYKTKYYTCHCTGIEQYEYLKEQMKEQLEYFATGDEIEI